MRKQRVAKVIFSREMSDGTVRVAVMVNYGGETESVSFIDVDPTKVRGAGTPAAWATDEVAKIKALYPTMIEPGATKFASI